MNKSRLVMVGVLVAALLAVFALPAGAQGAPEWNFVQVLDASMCGQEVEQGWFYGAVIQIERVNIEGQGTFYWDTIATGGGMTLMDEFFSFSQGLFTDGLDTWGIYDSNDRGLQTGSFRDVVPGTVITVTLTLRGSDGETILDQETFSFVCGTPSPAEPEEMVAVPGCDVLIPLPKTAVGGAFVADALTYWKPGELTNPLVTIPAGKTAWVIGPDATGAYTKILWGCQFLWVPSSTIGPNYDSVWNGTPLPTTPVQ